jgi:hypothetical protein
MPLTSKGDKILSKMRSEYGDEKGTSVFYAARNKGTISGVESRSLAGKRNTREQCMKRFADSLKKRAGRR